ncbi:hypothetical protein AMTRI_Chr06g191710 [Amborella trichopoda]
METKSASEMVAVIVFVLLVMGPGVVDGAFGIEMYPCTMFQCMNECKRVLKDKYLNAACSAGSQGKLCLCWG